MKKVLSLLIMVGTLVSPMSVYAEGNINYNCSQDVNDIGAKNDSDVQVKDAQVIVNGFRISVDTRTPRGQAIISAVNKIGCPYAWGGEGAPWSGSLVTGEGGTTEWKDANYSYEDCIGKPAYDCSGFVQAVYRDAGIDLSHFSGSQISGGKEIQFNQMKPGDLAGNDTHIVMYLGGGYIIEAPQTGETVRIISLKDRFGKTEFPSSYRLVSYFN